ncbi:MAG: hypothetical protein FWD46_08240 [Cystobacterineae bacterium]|nr:hypothetical protein [Cystobacterineae bacterium]
MQRGCPQCLGLLVLWVLPLMSWAWPVDMEFVLEKGQNRFVKLAAAEWLEVDDASVATAELFETQEILLEGKKPGVALVLVYAEGKMGIWRVRVEEPPLPPLPSPNTLAKKKAAAPLPIPEVEKEARQACPKLNFQKDKLPKIAGDVDTEACRQALLFLLMQPGWLGRELELVFEGSVLAAQLTAMQKAMDESLGKGKLKLRYVGATLEMVGKLSPKEYRKALWGVFFQSAGRIALDDSIQVLPPSEAVAPKEKKL